MRGKGREWKHYFTLKAVTQCSRLSQERWSFSRSNWTKHWETWSYLRPVPALNKRVDKEPPEVPFQLNYPMDLQCSGNEPGLIFNWKVVREGNITEEFTGCFFLYSTVSVQLNNSKINEFLGILLILNIPKNAFWRLDVVM